jgi:hypothetical protein
MEPTGINKNLARDQQKHKTAARQMLPTSQPPEISFRHVPPSDVQ